MKKKKKRRERPRVINASGSTPNNRFSNLRKLSSEEIGLVFHFCLTINKLLWEGYSIDLASAVLQSVPIDKNPPETEETADETSNDDAPCAEVPDGELPGDDTSEEES